MAPQSIYFSDPAHLDRARRVLDSHPDLVLLCRDSASYRLAKANFDVRVELCPDAAFLLPPLSRPIEPTLDLLWLARSDHEAAPRSSPDSVSLPAGVGVSDWMEDAPVGAYRRRHALAATLTSEGLPYAIRGHLAWLNPVVQELYLRLARNRVLRGANHLSRARVVISDRLHGHILCVLLGIPHIVLPSMGMKTANFVTTWTESTGLVRTCESASEALAAGRQIARELERGLTAPNTVAMIPP
jgi:pyruvyl transferase EpsO